MFNERQRLLTEAEIAQIRSGVQGGMRGPVLVKWVEQLLGDHDERVKLERERKGRGSHSSVRRRGRVRLVRDAGRLRAGTLAKVTSPAGGIAGPDEDIAIRVPQGLALVKVRDLESMSIPALKSR
jgi:hypothetical protein